MRILVCDPISEKGMEILRSIPNAKVDEAIGVKEEKLLEVVGNYEALVVRSGVKISDKVLQAAKKLKVIARAGMGYDNIDLDAATKRGVVVMNTPGQNAVTTAEHTIALMMSLARSIPQAQASLKGGKWDRKTFVGSELSGKVLGIVGLGNVGREVARRARGLKMDVVGYDPFISEKVAQEAGAVPVSLEDLYARSDFITLHTVLNDSTQHMISQAAIKKMKDRVRIINCARGGLIDEKALLSALNSGKVAGAALDVFETEPPGNGHPLIGHEKVVATPHLGASTDEAQESVALAAAEQVKTYLVDDIVVNGVNVPSVGRDVLAQLSGYIDLAAKLGRFLGQLGLEKVEEIRVEVRGEIAKFDPSPLTAGVLFGFIQKMSSESVNFVNAPLIARDRGIRVVESKSNEAMNYLSLLVVSIRSKKEEHFAWGSIFGRKYEKIVRFDNFFLEFSPRGHVLIIQNEDKPGVVAGWSSVLGKRKINISQMQVALDAERGEALSVVNIDTPAPKDAIEELRKVTNIKSVRQMVL